MWSSHVTFEQDDRRPPRVFAQFSRRQDCSRGDGVTQLLQRWPLLRWWDGLPAHQLGIGHSNTSDSINGGLSTPPHTDPSSNTLSSEALEPSRPQAPSVQQTQPILTDDQADFVNSLHANNVLAAAIVRVLESMMARERRPAIEGYAAAWTIFEAIGLF
ncbi:hypothetical protein BU15DRAFT_60973 [Melanogaster broomeanus]|nr:hypothetical protein BU15DRAFT_60973 [Melanogaster broomeanus]